MTSKCRFCAHPLTRTFVDLGMSPLSNRYLTAEQLNQMEPLYPLHAYVCDRCFLVQLDEFETPERIFEDYAYFSSYSDSWLEHARQYANQIEQRLHLDASSQVIEIASNDGYLLNFFQKKDIPVLGIEPATNVAKTAEHKGIRTLNRFFGTKLATELVGQSIRANLLIANNVLAHVPDLNDFVCGMKQLLAPRGTITIEVPHLARLIEQNQFDTIYHEHFSYFSFLTARQVLQHHQLTVFDVEELDTHGGSLRLYAKHAEDQTKEISDRVEKMKAWEIARSYDQLSPYLAFGERVCDVKRKLLSFLISAKQQGKRVVGYGAPAKGNTLLNYCGIRTDFLDFTVDRSPHKQGRFLPGTHIPIYSPERIDEIKPDYLLILPWNLREEIMQQMSRIRNWGGKFVVPIPESRVL
ncbi:MAG: class I SAM-dependent methyltransferase [Sulfuricaulis sp.]|uniref:class I SAM-dependent methyltransferase n=1 Tax=Sulfuricaulis sp. TaxID=2003553 RepID=UPI0025CE711F|nr:class I SAM-dependent methyltransferase [Sulfuricaulis sp.]MCR4346782.1 class I SAM-dependent methyltransferase [Sulfuricaulis sp.]